MEPKHAVNVYVCDTCHKPTSTINLNVGVTPMFSVCPYCDGMAKSMGYGIVIVLAANKIANITVTHAWYRPEVPEEFTEHLIHGGLVLATLTGALELYAKEDVCQDTTFNEFGEYAARLWAIDLKEVDGKWQYSGKHGSVSQSRALSGANGNQIELP